MPLDLSKIEDKPFEGVDQDDDGPPIIAEEPTEDPALEAQDDQPEEDKESSETPDEPIIKDAPVDAPVELKGEDSQVKIDGKVYTAKELKDQLLMRGDYTRKTQELATKQREYDEAIVESEEREIEVHDFVSRMRTPSEIINEFSSSMPEVWEKVQQAIVDRFTRIADMTEGELAQFLENERHTLNAWTHSRNTRVQKLIEDKRTARTQRSEMKKLFETSRADVMRSEGLDPENDAHMELVMDGITSVRNRGKRWSKDLLTAEVKRVATHLKAKPPKPAKKEAAPPPSPPAAEKPKVPPVKPPGIRKPEGGHKKADKKPLGSFFEDLRSRY